MVEADTLDVGFTALDTDVDPLTFILSGEQRILSKNPTLYYKNVVYQIQTSRPSYAMRMAMVMVCENAWGEISILYKGKLLTYSVYRKHPSWFSFIATIGFEIFDYCFASCFRVDLSQGFVINTGSRTHMASNP